MVNDVIADPLAVANQLRPVLLRLARELRQETEQLGVTSRQVTLLWLIRNNPGMSLRELAAEERISAPALSGHVDRLEKAGLLARIRSEDDRRRVGLALTDDGERLLKRVRARRTTWLAERLRGLDDDELVRRFVADTRGQAADDDELALLRDALTARRVAQLAA
jgi:DNA-binding MarR family transcriptional regulator